LYPKATTPTKKINIVKYFENLIIGLYIVCVLNAHVKFPTYRILFNIQSINLFIFMHNFIMQKLEI